MTKPLKKSSYQSILSDIVELCLNARKALGLMYWGTGRRIVVAEQEGSPRAPRGEQLILRLSKDLTTKFGAGFSKSNLERMRRFYLENRIAPPAVQLSIAHQIEALSIKDPKRRKAFLEKAMRKNLTREQFRQLLHKEKISLEPQLSKIEPPKEPVKLSVTRSMLYTYKILEPSYVHAQEGEMIVDLGFSNNTQVEAKGLKLKAGELVESVKLDNSYKLNHSDAKPKELYTYVALVERVVDADTHWLNIDCGFKFWTRKKVRLRGIDCPELSTKEGQAAKRFVEARLKEVSFIVVKTYKEEKYGRYLTDVFYLKDETNPRIVLEKGTFLNQELLDKGLARIF